MSNSAFDLRRLFDSNTRVTTLRELEKQGKSRVKVVNTTQIIELITQAVDTVVERRAMTLAEREREVLIRDSNDEFRTLVREREEERQTSQSQKETAEKYRTEIDGSRREVGRLRGELEDVRADLEREKRRSIELDEVKRNHQKSEAQLDELRLENTRQQRKIVTLEEESGSRLRSLERELSEEKTRCQDLESRQQRLDTDGKTVVDRYENKICSYEQKIETLLGELSEARERDKTQSGAFLSMVSDLQGLKSALEEARQQPSVDELARSQASMGDKLQEFFASRMEAIEQSLSQKLAGFQSGGAVAGGVVEPDIVLERLFGDHFTPMESNIGNLDVKESRGGDIAEQLARLRSMQGGALGGTKPSRDEEEGT